MKKPKIKLPQSGEMIGRLKTRSFRVGGYSVLATVIVVAIAVFANVLVNALPAKYTQFDTTSTQLYSISEQTELVLSGLEDEVTVYWIVQDGREDETLGTLLDRYAALSGELTVTKVDPDVQPTFVQQYTEGTIYNNSLVVECGDRNTYISFVFHRSTETFTEVTLTIYNYDSTTCIASLSEGRPQFVSRDAVEDIVEAVTALVAPAEE